MLYFAMGTAGGLASVLLFDLALRWLLRIGARYLPDDLAGPEGWLIDTTRRTGVFDQRA